jgi:argininosuccinate lyase
MEGSMTLWHGRFQSKLDPAAWDLNVSYPVDKRLALQDVRGSIAWAGGLVRADVLPQAEGQAIIDGLNEIYKEFLQGTFDPHETDEDIHTAVERRLGELIGPLAGKLHTGRSRNDQVSTDFRLWMMDILPQVNRSLKEFQSCLVEQTQKCAGLTMPGYTHMQRAQPILVSHWWMSFFWPLQRDRERINQLMERITVMPLGSGALAGTAYPIDREWLAEQLGFRQPSENSLDAVSDRDFAAEFLFLASLIGLHLSKLSEDVIIYSSSEFGFFELADAYSTGSSLMPQKKNPDLFELARGKSGVLIGLLTGLMVTLKGLPSSYDKDLQEDKRPVFEAADILGILLPALQGALGSISVRSERMKSAIDAGMLATDIADYLVRKGIPFRDAHMIVGKAVRLAGEKHVQLDQLSLVDWHTLGPISEDIQAVFDPLYSINQRNSTGGTAPEAVDKQIQKAKDLLNG